ncbi:unnamed protein product, partial [Owenia fusiformis]
MSTNLMFFWVRVVNMHSPPVARYNKLWGLPIITLGGLKSSFGNEDDFPILTRIVAPHIKLSFAMVKLLLEFNYYHVSLIWHTNFHDRSKDNSECNDVMVELIQIMQDLSTIHNVFEIDPYISIIDDQYLDDYDLNAIVGKIKNHSR